MTHDSNRRLQDTIDRLDTLIDEYIDQIRKDIAKHAKAGDLIRMIELRHKLLPDSSRQKEFWKMIENIRQEKLPDKGRIQLKTPPTANSAGDKS